VGGDLLGCKKGKLGSKVAFIQHALVCTRHSLILTEVYNISYQHSCNRSFQWALYGKTTSIYIPSGFFFFFPEWELKRSFINNFSSPFPGSLLPVTQWGREEGATYVQCPEEEGGTGEGHSEAAAPQSSQQRLWACKSYASFTICDSGKKLLWNQGLSPYSFKIQNSALAVVQKGGIYLSLSSVHVHQWYLANLEPLLT